MISTTRPSHCASAYALTAAAAAFAAPLAAQPVSALEPVVVSGSGIERRAFDTPYAVSVVDAAELRAGGLMVNLSEALGRVPGLVVNLRNNYAQDLQISSRGFGARSTFGVRGIRLYTDGIPASMPDGQGQVSHFDIAGAQRVEVLRGPFSALYGNSSGGVISLVSAAPQSRSIGLDVDAGSNGVRQVRVSGEAPLGGGFDIRAQVSRFETDGFRPQSEAQRDFGNVRLGWRGASDSVTLLLNSLDQPAQDPLGLTRAQLDADPYQTTSQATAFDTRKNTRQAQLGGQWQHRFTDLGPLKSSVLTAYGGQRSVTQWQAIAVATQAPPRHPGGVIDFDRDYAGVDARLVLRWAQVQLVAGVASERQNEDRRGFENFSGAGAGQVLGVTGKLRRDETNKVRTSDVYAQGEVEITPALSATLGARSGSLRVTSQDAFLSNGDDSGALKYSYTTPVAALQWRPSAALNLYVSAGRGFESPTLGELAYRPDGQPGFNTALRPQRSRQVEAGAKWRDAGLGLALDSAVFRAETDDEIGVQTNAGGRSTFQNVGRTTRNGAELSLRWQATTTWRAQLALTWLDATYRDGFLTCAGIPCAAPTVPVAAGNRIAGTVAKSAFAEVAWRAPTNTELALEVRAQGGMPVNDLNSDFAQGTTTAALRASQTLPLGPGQLELLARVDNLAGRRYAGSVIVNDSNARFFEPAAGRTVLLGAHWKMPF